MRNRPCHRLWPAAHDGSFTPPPSTGISPLGSPIPPPSPLPLPLPHLALERKPHHRKPPHPRRPPVRAIIRSPSMRASWGPSIRDTRGSERVRCPSTRGSSPRSCPRISRFESVRLRGAAFRRTCGDCPLAPSLRHQDCCQPFQPFQPFRGPRLRDEGSGSLWVLELEGWQTRVRETSV